MMRRPWHGSLASVLATTAMMCVLAASLVSVARGAARSPRAVATIDATPAAVVHRFVPARAIGAAIDGHERGASLAALRTSDLDSIRTAGLGALAYRLRTELAGEAWHWNPLGRWSDAADRRGYWVSSDSAGAPITLSWGYRLPRRGNTFDQANRDGWSRLDDGDTTTFWKSDPYLAPRFTGEPERAHPAWVVADLGAVETIDGARIAWGEPYAARFRLQWWAGDPQGPFMLRPDGSWRDFPAESVWTGEPGSRVLRLAERPVSTRWVRIVCERGSCTAPPGATDPRDSLGVAIRELWIGRLGRDGRLSDVLRHAPDASRQSEMRVSSTDPWHREQDRDPDIEQPGIDLVLASPLAGGQPVMFAVGVLYDIPENAAALVRYLRARDVALERLELGEEPDGQDVDPVDFAERYRQTARAVLAVDPELACGGPSLQDTEDAERAWWPARTGAPRHWIARFLAALQSRRSRDTFRFLTFEWYPFDRPCPPIEPQVTGVARRFDADMERLRGEGAPRDVPWIVSEYGYSVRACEAAIGLPGALVDADLVGRALTRGVDRVYFYGIEPDVPSRDLACAGWGGLMLFLADTDHHATQALPAAWAMRLLTHEWVGERDAEHAAHPVRVVAASAADSLAAPGVFALARPDGRWGVLLVNRDARRSWEVAVRIADGTAGGRPLAGPLRRVVYDASRWQWAAAGERGHAVRAGSPLVERAGGRDTWALPPWSITVLVGDTLAAARP